jgi:hypothetical protein
MRLSPLVIAGLVAIAPWARADEPAQPPVEAAREQAPATTPPASAAQGRGAATLPAPPANEEPATAPDEPRGPPPRTSRVGLAVAGGFPDLVTASLMFRPLRTLRVFAGPAWGYVAWGANAGVLLEPWQGSVSPTFSFEIGELFQADASFLVKDGSDPATRGMKPLLRQVNYAYGSVDVGLELGSSRGLAFFVRAGLSYVSLKAGGTASYTTDQGAKVALSNPWLHGTFPSVKAGLQYFF